jgi:hypothetical protein
VAVPFFLTQQTPPPDIKLVKNGDLARLALKSYPKALKQCNADKQRIREFSDKEVEQSGVSKD